jgi:large-conductance mechanosensitive channel
MLFYCENQAGCATIAALSGLAVDDSPKAFGHEFKSAILKKRVGQIALAVVLAEACLRFLGALAWYLVIPLISSRLEGHTESVLFTSKPIFPWQQLFGSCLEFALAIIFVFYINRWIRGSLPGPRVIEDLADGQGQNEETPAYFNLAGQPLSPTEQGPAEK